MNGYLSFDEPCTSPAGRILAAITAAGNRYHHTENWGDEHHGETCCNVIERVVFEVIDEKDNVIQRQRETLDKLPKCWRLRDGKLIQDVPVVPGMTLWFWNGFADCAIEGPEQVRIIHFEDDEWGLNDGSQPQWFYNSREAAAIALRERISNAEN